MRGHVRHSVPLVLGLLATAILAGATIAQLAESAIRRLLVIAPLAILVAGVAVWAAPAAVGKCRRLGAALRWWHWLWLFLFLSGLVFRGRDVDAIYRAPLDAWGAWRAGLVGLVAIVLFARLPRGRTDWLGSLVRGLPAGICAYGVISLVSTLWSIYPPWTLYRSIEYLIDTALLAAVVTSVRGVAALKSLFDWHWFLSGVLMLLVWVEVVLLPDVAVTRGIGLIGLQIQAVVPSISANSVGGIGAVLLIVAVTRLVCRRRHQGFYWLACLAALLTLIFAQSRTAAVAALLGILAVLLAARRFGLIAFLGVAGVAVAALTSAAAVVQQAFLRGQSPELFYSLTGRVAWWTAAWEIYREHLLLGLGGYAGGRFGVLAALGATETSTLHNAWLEVLVGVGLIGLVPVLATYVGVWCNLLWPPDSRSASPVARELHSETVGLWVMLSVGSFSGVEFIWHPPLLFFLVVTHAELLRRSRLEASRAPHSVLATWRRNSRSQGSGTPGAAGGRLRDAVHGS
jgi:O-antigen ligase